MRNYVAKYATKTNSRPQRHQSVLHALRVLNLFSPNDPRWSVTRVAEALKLSKSTVSRLLSTMRQEGYVLKDPETGRYELGLRVFEVGLAFLAGLSLRRVAMPVLEELAFAVRETVYLGILGDGVGICIDKILSPLSLRVDSYIGSVVPLHATALGKVLLAGQPDAYTDALAARGLRAYTHRTMTTTRELHAALRLIRRQGYAVDLEELEDGLHCMAFPIRDHRANVMAAYSVSGPSVRFTRQCMQQNLELFRRTADAISQRLGFSNRSCEVEKTRTQQLHLSHRSVPRGLRVDARGR